MIRPEQLSATGEELDSSNLSIYLQSLDGQILRAAYQKFIEQPEEKCPHLMISLELPEGARNIVISQKSASIDPRTRVPSRVFQELYLVSFEVGRGYCFSLALPVRARAWIDGQESQVYLEGLRTHNRGDQPVWDMWQEMESGRVEPASGQVEYA